MSFRMTEFAHSQGHVHFATSVPPARPKDTKLETAWIHQTTLNIRYEQNGN